MKHLCLVKNFVVPFFGIIFLVSALLLSACNSHLVASSPGSQESPENPMFPPENPELPPVAVVSPVTWFVSDSDVPQGEPAGKAKTVKEGLNQIRSAHKKGAFAGNRKALMVITGTINAAAEAPLSNNSLVSISGAGNYPPLILRGGSSGGVLDGENQVRVLNVTNNTVTIAEGLSLTRGNSKTHNENYGGGVYLEQSALTMTGGSISDCTAEYGSGVFIFEDKQSLHSSFNMTGGTISGGSGSAVYVDQHCSFTLSGAGLITGNGTDGSTYAGGGVQIEGYGKFVMDGGTIRGNKASATGGGVNVTAFATFIMNGGTITENTAPAKGGSGIFVSQYGAVFTKNGGTVSGNFGVPDIEP